MRITSMIAIYFVIWWIALFSVLPFGVRSAAETGQPVDEGHDAGAPVLPGLAKKAAATTVLSAVIFAGVYWAYTHGVFG